MDLGQRTFSGRVSDADIRLLRVFCTVTRHGGFAAAESELQIGLPSVSRYIKDLETRLGVRLCKRGRAGFALTDEGRQVYSASLQLIADLERFELNIRSIHSDLVGVLNIGVVDTLITDKNFCIPAMLRAYKQRYPYVQINISVKTTNIIEQSIIDGSLDAGLIIGRRRIEQLAYYFLYHEVSNLYCAEDHPICEANRDIRVEDLSKCDYAGYHFVQETEKFKVQGLVNKTASVDHMEAVATLISTGCFIGFLPDHYVKSVSHSKQFRKILPETFSFTSDIELTTRRDVSSPLVLAFLKQLGSGAKPPEGDADALCQSNGRC
jgi:LysR family transcriptional regulator, transcriptional activator for bauABCD operon